MKLHHLLLIFKILAIPQISAQDHANSSCPVCALPEDASVQTSTAGSETLTESSKPSSDTIRRLGTPPMINNRPIIGILAHEYLADKHPHARWECEHIRVDENTTFIPAEMVKFVELGGARAVPIFTNRNESYLLEMFQSINGLFLGGGTVHLRNSQYSRASKFLLELAVRANDAGDYFPVWGECLGFQFMLWAAGGYERTWKTPCRQLNRLYDVKFTKFAAKSRLYSRAKKSVLESLAKENVTTHNHVYCITVKHFRKFHFQQKYRILTTNYLPKRKVWFVSSAEAVDYPFYVLAFHPEAMYWWGLDTNIAHTSEGTEVSQYFAKFLVDEARRNSHVFKTVKEENKNLIVNYQTSCNDDLYLFPRSSKNKTKV